MVVVTVRPTADGYYVAHFHSGDAYDNVSDVFPDEDSSYIYGSNTKFSLFVIDPSSIPANAIIQSVKVYTRSKYVSGSGSQYPIIGQVSTNTEDYPYSASLTSSYATTSYTWTTNPWESRDWTRADLDDLQIGARTYTVSAAFEARCTQIYAEITYILPTIAGGAQIIGLECL